jgi:predicted enzyme related to lactoylglutathione lyase
MPHVEKHAPGSFNWIELVTTDLSAAKRFYGALFGWQAEDLEGGIYTWFKLNGRDTAGCYTSDSGQIRWNLYVAVDDANYAEKRAIALGATPQVQTCDFLSFGRTAEIQDPTGAAFSVWQPGSHIGTGIAGEHGTFIFADLNTPDRHRAKDFYQALFGWNFVTGKDKTADSYLHIKNGDTHIGGILPDSHRNKNEPPHWLICFQVADCDASTAKGVELGARVHISPMSIGSGPENSLRYAVLADPQGAAFALFQGSA